MKPYFDAIPAFAALPHPFFFQSSMAAAPDLNPGSTGIALVRGTTRIPMKLTTDSGDVFLILRAKSGFSERLSVQEGGESEVQLLSLAGSVLPPPSCFGFPATQGNKAV